MDNQTDNSNQKPIDTNNDTTPFDGAKGADTTQAYTPVDDTTAEKSGCTYAMGAGSVKSERPFDQVSTSASSSQNASSWSDASQDTAQKSAQDKAQNTTSYTVSNEGTDWGAQASQPSQAEYVQAEQVDDGKRPGDIIRNINVKGKTKHRKKYPQWMKYLAVLLIGALIGGASGGLVASRQSSSKITTVSSARNTENISYDASGNMTISSIAQTAMPAVVSVYNIGTSQSIFGTSQSNATGYGSGVIISDDGTIITNYHVIENADSVVVVTSDDKRYEAKVLGADSSLDLAVLKIDDKDLPYLEIANSDELQVGDLAVAIGNPLGSEFANTVTDGIISGLDRKINTESGETGFIQTNASINSGNSGGALVNGQAQLIGINSMKIQSNGMSSVEGMGFAIPSNTVVDFVNSVKSGETSSNVKKAWLGISGYNMDEEIAQKISSSQTTGVLIGEITEGGPSSSAGLEVGDIITAADGTEVTNFNDLTAVLEKKTPGEKIKLTIIRGQDKGEVEVVLGTKS